MAEFYKKVFSLKSTLDSLNVKGVFKIVINGKNIDCTIVITSGINRFNDLKIVVFDNTKNQVFSFDNSNVFSFKIVDFNEENLSLAILQNNNVLAYAKTNKNVTDFDINYAKTIALSPLPTTEFNYDDEALSPYNYYEQESNLRNENFNLDAQNEAEKEKEIIENNPFFNEANVNNVACDKIFSKNEKLNEILNSYPANETLSSILPKGRFVAVNYDAENAYFVGKTTFFNSEYHCVAVKGYYGGKRLENSFFIPSSPLDFYGEGYFVQFKNLLAEETVKNLLNN